MTIAEMVAASGVGATIARVEDHVALFSEAPGRVLLCVDPEQMSEVMDLIEKASVPYERVGLCGGDRLKMKGLLDLSVSEVSSAWRDRLPDALGSGTKSA